MKIGSKIALFYTLISVLTTVIIIAVFYIFSTQYINNFMLLTCVKKPT